MPRSRKPKLRIMVGQAWHFLRWELPIYERFFELVSSPSEDTAALAFGPDVFQDVAEMPALRRFAVLFPGFNYNPYYDLDYRRAALRLIETRYDLVFVNSGPLLVAYKSSSKIVVYPFSIDTSLARFHGARTRLDSLLHVSADDPHKDWRRSARVMELSGLRSEVFPPRNTRVTNPPLHRIKRRLNNTCERLGLPPPFKMLPLRYVNHAMVVKKYQEYDGFVHVAAPFLDKTYLDGKYTACLLEAGATGAILFWHDTLGLGNDLETVFELPVEPEAAARELLRIRQNLDVEQHSRLTQQEIRDRFAPEPSVGQRCTRMLEVLESTGEHTWSAA